ncbi:YggT family protein [Fictibacillus sp. S7]|uniref:YggT family protein n=1 Tax=Fictibacillus sp. S7 TaxID=2212476 RepID=UPI003CD0E0F3
MNLNRIRRKVGRNIGRKIGKEKSDRVPAVLPAVLNIVDRLLIGQYIYDIYYWLMFITILGSWFPQFNATKVCIWISKLVDPYFAIFRRFIPPLGVIFHLYDRFNCI